MTKKAVLLAAYEALAGRDARYGRRECASQLAAELAAPAGLQPGTARTYLYAHLDGEGRA